MSICWGKRPKSSTRPGRPHAGVVRKLYMLLQTPFMSRTFNNKKKMEGRLRKLEAEMEKKRLEEQQQERKLEEYWSIGAREPGRKEREEEKRASQEKKKRELKELYEKEMESL